MKVCHSYFRDWMWPRFKYAKTSHDRATTSLMKAAPVIHHIDVIFDRTGQWVLNRKHHAFPVIIFHEVKRHRLFWIGNVCDLLYTDNHIILNVDFNIGLLAS